MPRKSTVASAKVKQPKAAKKADKPLVAYKGFNADLTCLGHKFEIGKTYTHKGTVRACSSGFHACKNPLDVWSYYALGDGNRFCRVHLSGTTDKHEGDSKIAAETIFVETEVTLGEMIKEGIRLTVAAAKADDDIQAASGYSSKLAASGNYSKLAASGNYSKLAASGDYSQLAASGDYSQLAASGDSSKLAASGNYSKLAASGDYSQLAASGYSSKLAASGNYSKLEVTGKKSAAAAVGNRSSIKASKGTPIAICEYDRDGNPIVFVTGIAGKDGVPADTWLIAKDGKFVEAK